MTASNTATHGQVCQWLGLTIDGAAGGWYQKADAMLYDATFAANNFKTEKTFTTVAECANYCLEYAQPWPMTDLDSGEVTNFDTRCGSFNWRQRSADVFWCTLNIAGTRESALTAGDQAGNFRLAAVQDGTGNTQDYYEIVGYKEMITTHPNRCYVKPDAMEKFSTDYYNSAACKGLGYKSR